MPMPHPLLEKSFHQVKKDVHFFTSKKNWRKFKPAQLIAIFIVGISVVGVSASMILVQMNSDIRQQAAVDPYAECNPQSRRITSGTELGACQCIYVSAIVEPGEPCPGPTLTPSMALLINGSSCSASNQCASGYCDLLLPGTRTCQNPPNCDARCLNGCFTSDNSCKPYCTAELQAKCGSSCTQTSTGGFCPDVSITIRVPTLAPSATPTTKPAITLAITLPPTSTTKPTFTPKPTATSTPLVTLARIATATPSCTPSCGYYSLGNGFSPAGYHQVTCVNGVTRTTQYCGSNIGCNGVRCADPATPTPTRTPYPTSTRVPSATPRPGCTYGGSYYVPGACLGDGSSRCMDNDGDGQYSVGTDVITCGVGRFSTATPTRRPTAIPTSGKVVAEIGNKTCFYVSEYRQPDDPNACASHSVSQSQACNGTNRYFSNLTDCRNAINPAAPTRVPPPEVPNGDSRCASAANSWDFLGCYEDVTTGDGFMMYCDPDGIGTQHARCGAGIGCNSRGSDCGEPNPTAVPTAGPLHKPVVTAVPTVVPKTIVIKKDDKETEVEVKPNIVCNNTTVLSKVPLVNTVWNAACTQDPINSKLETSEGESETTKVDGTDKKDDNGPLCFNLPILGATGICGNSEKPVPVQMNQVVPITPTIRMEDGIWTFYLDEEGCQIFPECSSAEEEAICEQIDNDYLTFPTRNECERYAVENVTGFVTPVIYGYANIPVDADGEIFSDTCDPITDYEVFTELQFENYFFRTQSECLHFLSNPLRRAYTPTPTPRHVL